MQNNKRNELIRAIIEKKLREKTTAKIISLKDIIDGIA